MRKVEVTTDIQATPSEIIAAFTETKMLREWWHVERSLIDKRPGGLYTLTWNISDKGFGFVSTGVIKEYQENSKLVVENFVYLNPEKSFLGPMILTIEAKEKPNTTSFYLCQDGYQQGADWDWYYEAVRQAWPQVVQKLKDYLEEIIKSKFKP